MPASYSFLTKITDPVLRNAFKVLLDRVHTLESSTAAIGTVSQPLDDHLDANANRLTNVADPTADQDAVTLRHLRTYVDARLTSAGLIDPATGQATPTADSDGGQAQAGVAAAGATGDLGVGDLTAYRAGLIIGGVAHEYPALVAATPDQATRDANQLELLLRVIWHLKACGFTAGRQQNPSGVVSGDKIAVITDGQLRAYDIFTGVYTGDLVVQAFLVTPPNLVAEAGTPD